MNAITRKTVYAFLLLLIGSWVIELVVGTRIVAWYWGSAWVSDLVGVQVSERSIAEAIASFSGRWTPGGVVSFFIVVFLALHLINAIRFGLLDPFLKRHHLGARNPSQREQEQFTKVYQGLTRTTGGIAVARPRRVLIADGLGLQMRFIGYVLVIDRELLWNRHFPALLAVELGHTNSEDRLAHRIYDMLPITAAIVGLMVGLPFALGHVLFFPLWVWYWRERVYSADAFAVSLGQGRALIRALDEIYLKLDRTTRGGRWLKPVPYIEQRIDRIERALAEQQAGGGAPRSI